MKHPQRPLIGITAGEIYNKISPQSPITHGQSITFIQAVVHAGGVPIVLPLIDDESIDRALYERCDAILFAGGNDPDPALYGEKSHPTVTDQSVLRDTVELRWMRWSLVDDKPVMGICRGMDMLNIALGGSLYQDIAAMLPYASDHNHSVTVKGLDYVAHLLRLEPESRFAQIVGVKTLGTNTHHHQATKKLGKGLRVVAWSEDGIIEAIELSDKPFVIGVQSHPESMEAEAVTEWRRFFAEFVRQAAVSAKQAR